MINGDRSGRSMIENRPIRLINVTVPMEPVGVGICRSEGYFHDDRGGFSGRSRIRGCDLIGLADPEVEASPESR